MMPADRASTSADDAHPRLSPWPVRLIVYVVLVLVAVASIWLIDRRAMQRMIEYRQTHQPAASAAPDPTDHRAQRP